jgi:signal transduction histidine kinase
MYQQLRAQLIGVLLLSSAALFARQKADVDSLTIQKIVDLVYADQYEMAIDKIDSVQKQYILSPTRGTARLFLQVGAAFNEKGDYGASQQYAYMALNLAVQEGWGDIEAESLIDIGYSYYFLGQLDKGLEYAQRALVLTRKLHLDTLSGTAHNLLGILHAKSNHPGDTIMYHYKKALAIRQSLKNARGIASSMSNIGMQLERENKFDEALTIQKRSLQIDDSIGNEYGVAWSHQMIGELLIKMKRFEEANQYLTEAEKQSNTLKAREILLQTYRSRSHYLAEQNRFKEALQYSNLYITLRDSIYNAGLASKVSYLQQSFETRERDRQIARQQAAIEAQLKIFLVVAVAVVAVVILLLIYYRSYKKTLSLNTELIERTEEIQTQAEELTEANQALHTLNKQIAEQKEELQAQAEELIESNQTISILNDRLHSDIEVKKDELFKTNQELVKHNNELMQFSFTVSHNLRAPVARMLGLMNLISLNVVPEEKDQLIGMLQKSTSELDAILKDLNLIIDSRSPLMSVREKISLEDCWYKTISLVQENILSEYTLKGDFSEAPHVYSVRAMVQNIFYNLLSNALRYCSPDRPLHIDVKSAKTDGNTVITFSDNGLGLDMGLHGKDLFKLYKRFHSHVTGKGLGLYLVKTQVESLGGTIYAASELNKGTRFTVVLPDALNVEEQVLLDKESAKLYYDANINNTVIIWKRNINSKEYHEVFDIVLETLRTYNTPAWIADLRNQGRVSAEDQRWFMTSVLPQAVECGLKRIGTIGFSDPIRKEYLQNMLVRAKELGIDLRDFDSIEDVKAWMERSLTMQ